MAYAKYKYRKMIMPRPKKKKRITNIPICSRFAPEVQDRGKIELTVDELEAIRLTDLMHLDQSECAREMNVARTTAQNIINSAHQKIADALVNGKVLEISGGDYEYDDDFMELCCASGHTLDKIGGIGDIQKGKKRMRLAVTFDPETEEIFQHFGRTEFFKVYEIEDGMIVSSEVKSTNGQGHGALAGVLNDLGAEALICGGIGGGAQMALASSGVKLFGGVAGKCDDAAKAFADGNLQYQEDVRCDHHGEHDHHEGGCSGHCHH